MEILTFNICCSYHNGKPKFYTSKKLLWRVHIVNITTSIISTTTQRFCSIISIAVNYNGNHNFWFANIMLGFCAHLYNIGCNFYLGFLQVDSSNSGYKTYNVSCELYTRTTKFFIVGRRVCTIHYPSPKFRGKFYWALTI